jgi:hypothetical protein
VTRNPGGLAPPSAFGVCSRHTSPRQHIFDESLRLRGSLPDPTTLRVRIPGGRRRGPSSLRGAFVSAEQRIRPARQPSATGSVHLTLRVDKTRERKRTFSLTAQSRVSHDPRKAARGSGTIPLASAESPGLARRMRGPNASDLSTLGKDGGVARESRVRSGEGSALPFGHSPDHNLEPPGAIYFERDLSRTHAAHLDKSRRMVEGRSSLGFSDLPATAGSRSAPIGSFERRFPALGRDSGTDLRKPTPTSPWIGNRIPSPVLEEPVEKTFPHRGPRGLCGVQICRARAKLRVHAEPRTAAHRSENPKTTRVQWRPSGESGELELFPRSAEPTNRSRSAAEGSDGGAFQLCPPEKTPPRSIGNLGK